MGRFSRGSVVGGGLVLRLVSCKGNKLVKWLSCSTAQEEVADSLQRVHDCFSSCEIDPQAFQLKRRHSFSVGFIYKVNRDWGLASQMIRVKRLVLKLLS